MLGSCSQPIKANKLVISCGWGGGGYAGYFVELSNILKFLTSIFSGLTLRIVKVSWYSDHSIGDFLSKVRFCCFLHLCENHRGNLKEAVINNTEDLKGYYIQKTKN